MKQVNRLRLIFAGYDIVLVVFTSLLVAFIHDGLAIKHRDESYLFALVIFPFLWILISLVTRKFRIGERSSQKEVFLSILFSNFIIVSASSFIMVLTGQTYFSRFIFFGTVAGITVFEMITGIIYVSLQKSVYLRDWIGLEIPPGKTLERPGRPATTVFSVPGNFEALRESITGETSAGAFEWIRDQADITDPKTLILATDNRFNLLNLPGDLYRVVINLHRINDLTRINKFFETVNSKLPAAGVFIGCAETYTLRKNRILKRFPPLINYLVYTVDFIIHRVFPKLILTNKLYFLITGGKKRVLSRTETLGRLCSCGFEIAEEKTIGDLLYFRTMKARVPFFDTSPTYGAFIHLRRIGRNGKEFKVYKLRTMHAYAEYLQGYVHEKNQLAEGGKFRDDFRVTTVGRLLRKLWLDELPMLMNVLKGDMKIVGVRPLSRHYFSLYSEELRQKRILRKPGLIPPYYAQFPTPRTLEEVQENEMKYLLAYEQHPLITDVKYFFRAIYNILWNRARSN